MFLDECILENKGLVFSGRHKGVETFGPLQHHCRFIGMFAGGLEIGEDPFPEIFCLANVKDEIGFVPEKVYTRPFGQFFPDRGRREFLFFKGDLAHGIRVVSVGCWGINNSAI